MSKVLLIYPSRPTVGNSYGWESLLTVLEFTAEEFCRSSAFFGQFRQQIYAGQAPTFESMRLIAGELGAMQRLCERLGLAASLAQIERVKEMLFGENQGSYPRQLLADAVMEVGTRIHDELHSRKCYMVNADRNVYITGNLFDESARVRFPDAIPDMDEAARCFAFERPTACIFHLMRVTEYGINAIADLLSIDDHNPTWEPIIKKIDAELKTPYKDRKYKGNQDVLANMSTHLHAVKVAWRNKTMHVEKINTMEHAGDIYNATKGLMRYLAENLPQKKVGGGGVIEIIRGKLGV